MADDDIGGGKLDPRSVMNVNTSPLQRPGHDTLLRTVVLAGPEQSKDRRMYLSSGLLAELLDKARASSMGRVVVDRVGVRVDLYSRPDGHQYEVWTFVGADPRPEPLPAFVQQGE